jgi:hypothetical protein
LNPVRSATESGISRFSNEWIKLSCGIVGMSHAPRKSGKGVLTNEERRWHRDLLVFAVFCVLWSALLIFRVVISDPFTSQAFPFQDVLFGVKFYGRAAHITMTIQAID